jgi:hypothetical protein
VIVASEAVEIVEKVNGPIKCPIRIRSKITTTNKKAQAKNTKSNLKIMYIQDYIQQNQPGKGYEKIIHQNIDLVVSETRCASGGM